MAIRNGTSVANLLNGTSSADTIDGKAGNDTLIGAGGNDTLIGGTGNDSMAGGAGNDLYIVNSTLDKVSEAGGNGIDTVQSSVNWTLGAGLENLVLTGTAANGTGNSAANKLTGNGVANRLSGLGGNDTLSGAAGNDTLDGGTGTDSLAGGAGNDTYIVDSTADKVNETAPGSSGTDAVRSSATYTLGSGIEKLTLTGTAAIDGTGNSSANTITGNGAGNTLNGAGGNDTLNGGGGNDSLAGGSGADSLAGGAGADTLSGGTGSDTLAGGGDDDVLVFDAADAQIDGGAGIDTLRVLGDANLRAVDDGVIRGIEIADLAAGVTLKVAASDVIALLDDTDMLIVNGAAGAAIDAQGVWTILGVVEEGYTDYANGEATLRVQDGIDTDGITTTLMSALAVSALDGTNGFRLDGVAAGDQAGRSVAGAGDVNGDGFDDLLIAAPYADPGGAGNAGSSYVVFGAASGFGSAYALSALAGATGFRIDGAAAGNASGGSVAGAGDFNGDGYADLLVGAGNNIGARGYLVYGEAADWAPELDLSTLDGANVFGVGGTLPGVRVAGAGDVNGDGYADLILGAYDDSGTINGTTPASVARVVFGNATGDGGDSSLGGLLAHKRAGFSVASAGDVNGDGYGDVVIGTPLEDGGPAVFGSDGTGASYVVFGQASGFALTDLLDGSNGFLLDGIGPDDYSGHSVASAGDFNGDGFADVIVRARSGAYLVYGKASGFAASIDLSALDGTDGFHLSGFDANYSGRTAAPAGDVNGDGFDDLIVGNYGYAASYVVFGSASAFDSTMDVSALDGANGFRIDDAGRSVASAGDVNGDGYADLIVGHNSVNGGTGASYVIYGRDFRDEADFGGTAGDDAITGTAGADIIVGGRGSDTLSGGGGADAIRGGQGDDRIVIGDAAFFDIDGGSGTDTLVVGANALNLDLTAIANTRLTGIEKIDLSGFGNNTLTLSLLDVLSLSDTSNTLTIDGDVGDSVSLTSGSWSGGAVIDGYRLYTSGAATVRIDEDIPPLT